MMTHKKTLLHAGPPIQWSEMTGPMKGACIGAALFERWADNEEDALKIFLKLAKYVSFLVTM